MYQVRVPPEQGERPRGRGGPPFAWNYKSRSTATSAILQSIQNSGTTLKSKTSVLAVGADSSVSRTKAGVEEIGELSEWNKLCSVVEVNMASSLDP